MTERARERLRLVLRRTLIVIYLVAGVLHIARPGFFMRIVPFWVPWPRETVIATGACEIAGSIGLAVPRLRRLAGVMLALYAVCVWPANMKHALDYAHSGAGWTGWIYHVPRLLFQPVIVWWSLFAAAVTDWPWRQSPSPLQGRKPERGGGVGG